MKRDIRMNQERSEGVTMLAELPAMKAIGERIAQAEASPPHKEVIEPRHTERVRPDGPRKRDSSEPRNLYRGVSIRIDLMPDQVNGDTYFLESQKPLLRHQQDMIIAAGFDPIGELDTAMSWQGTRQDVLRAAKDLSLMGAVLDGKGERLGRSR
jgi:hypothetical protein